MSRSRNLDFSAEHNVFILDTNPAATRGQGRRDLDLPPQEGTPSAPPRRRTWRPVPRPTRSLTWLAVPGVTEYNVYRADAAEPWKLTLPRSCPPETSFEDTDVVRGKVYFYTVRAVAKDGAESRDSFRARTQPRVLLKPVVSVLAADKVEVTWNKHPAKDVAGYNVYRGVVSVRTVRRDAESVARQRPRICRADARRSARHHRHQETERPTLDAKPSSPTRSIWTNAGAESKDYKYAVYAYIVRAVNKLGVESGPSPYAMTIPSDPTNVLNREKGDKAELKWDANPENGIAGYTSTIWKARGASSA